MVKVRPDSIHLLATEEHVRKILKNFNQGKLDEKIVRSVALKFMKAIPPFKKVTVSI